jgi:hypothetical protein
VERGNVDTLPVQGSAAGTAGPCTAFPVRRKYKEFTMFECVRIVLFRFLFESNRIKLDYSKVPFNENLAER